MKMIRDSKNKKILFSIIAVALPIVIEGIVFQIQSLTDKAFLGNLDPKYISALGAAQFPFGATFVILTAISTGMVIIISQLYGAGKTKSINKYVKSTMFYNSLISFLLFVLWFVFPQQVLSLFSVDADIMQYSVEYVKICSIYFLFLGIDTSLQAMLQGFGNTKPIMITGIIKVVLDIFLSWVLVFGYFGFPAMDVAGAAIGSLIANIISCIFIVVYCFVIKNKQYQLRSENTQWFDFSYFREVIKLGLPTGIEFFLWNASNLVLIKFLNEFNYMATAIYTLTFGIEVIVFEIFNGNSRSTMTLMGQSIGARENKRANQQLAVCAFLNFVVVMLAVVVFIAFPKQIISIFTKDAKTIAEAVPYLIFTAIIMVPKSLNIVLGNGIRAFGNTKWMLYSQILGSIFVVLCSICLVKVFHMEMVAIYVTLFFDESIRAGINYWYYLTHYKNKTSDVKGSATLCDLIK